MNHAQRNNMVSRACGTERPPLVPRPHLRSEVVDVDLLIHTMEIEAYASVLKAFVAQSDLLSWEKEGLITMLRKELNVTDIEHGELLVKFSSDESIKTIRGKQKGTLSAEQTFYAQMNDSGIAIGLTNDIPHKRLKTTPAVPPKSIKYTLQGQPSSAAISSHPPPESMDEQDRCQLSIVPAGAANKPMKLACQKSQAPSDNRVGEPHKFPLKKRFYEPDVGNVKKASNTIEIRATNMLIQEIERVVYGRKSPDPSQLEKSKLLLREHERAICEALTKIADVLEEDQLQPYYYLNEFPGTGRGFVQVHSEGRRVRFVDID